MVVNEPSVVAEVRAAFDDYEQALLRNDLDALEGWFWDGDGTVRFAFGELQVGAAAIAAARAALPRQTPPRTIERLEITTFGHAAATASAVCHVEGGGVVHQSQTWVRFDGGWRIVAAHVSKA